MAIGICWDCDLIYEFADADFEVMKAKGCPVCGNNKGLSLGD